MLTVEHLRELLNYDPETGAFTWLVDQGRVKAGTSAGYVNDNGYRIMMIGGRNFRSARLAWAIMTGAWPEVLVDHEDRDPGNNRWSNLRLATKKQNAENVSRHSDASPGRVGVYWNRRRQQWQAKICHHYKQIHLGWFFVEAEAVAARERAAQQLFTHAGA